MLTNRDERLISAGWKRITSQRLKYGTVHYWDHPDFQKEDGYWHTTAEAEAIQIRVDREARKLSRTSDSGRVRRA